MSVDEAQHVTDLGGDTEADGARTVPSDGAGPSHAAADRQLMRGAAIGRYVVLDILGEGGMGVVYAAYDPQLDRRVAIKLLHPTRVMGERAQARLLREAQAIARISHPNVIAVHDVGEYEDSVFVAMEFVEGETLTRWMEGNERSVAEVLAMMRQAGLGLAAAHAAGIVHRDFKPDNVLVGRDGRARVLDFGLARGQVTRDSQELAAEVSASASLPRWSQLDAELTVEGAVMGTPAYMAPEQHVGKPATTASDQFAFCICVYQGLYGHRPFLGTTAPELARAVIRGEVREPPPGTSVPSQVREVVLRGLRPRAQDRYPSMEALLRDLARDRAGRRRRFLATGALVVLVGGAVTAAYMSGTRRRPDPCAEAGKGADEVWNRPRRQLIAAALTGTGRPHAAETWERAATVIDAYVDGWREQRQNSCRATFVLGTQSEHLLDRRGVCFDNRMVHLDALLETFEEGDPKLADHALGLVHAMPALSACSEAQALAPGVPPPATQELQARVDEADEALAWAEARASAGRYREAIARLEPWLREAEKLGYQPLVARLRHRLGGAYSSISDERGMPMLERAYLEGLESGDDRIVIMAGVDTAQALGDTQRRSAEALRILDVVDAVIRRSQPKDLAIRVGALSARAVLSIRAGDHETAGELFRRVVQLQEEGDPKDPNLVVALQNLGGYYAERRRFALASDYNERARKLAVELYGEDHPSLRDLYQNLGNIELLQQRYDEAEHWLERSLRLQRRVYDADHPEIARTLTSLGRVERARGNFVDAERLQREGLEMLRRTLGEDSPFVAEATQAVALTKLEAGQFSAAVELARAAVDLYAARLGPIHPETAGAREILAGTLLKVDRPEDALREAEQGLEAFADEADSPRRLGLLRMAAAAERDLGRINEARELGEEGLALAQRRGTPLQLASHRLSLATTLAELGPEQAARARDLAERARTVFVEHHDDRSNAEADALLATLP